MLQVTLAAGEVSVLRMFMSQLLSSLVIMELKAEISLFTNSLNCLIHQKQEFGTLGCGPMWDIAT